MIFFDSHVHLYPEYDLDALFSSFVSNAVSLVPPGSGDVSLAMAVQLREFQPSLEAAFAGHTLAKWRIVSLNGEGAVVTDGTHTVAVVPARQIAAKERIEALGFFGEATIPDGLPLKETIKRVRDASMTPAIAWGLGKWLGKRGKIVREIIDSATAPLFVADSALRPTFWCEPIYAAAKANGLRFLYGSDPLPGKADESQVGRYAMLIDAKLDASTSAQSLLSALMNSNVAITPAGRRYGLVSTINHLK